MTASAEDSAPPPGRMGGATTELGRHLAREWARLADQPHNQRILANWQRDQPALATYRNLHDLAAAVAGTSTSTSNGLGMDLATAGRDETLIALITLSQSGQRLAGRVVVQGLADLMERLARKTWGLDPTDHLEDRVHAAIAELWDLIGTFPLDRCTTGVATRLRLDVLHRISPHRHTLGARHHTLPDQPLDVDLPGTSPDPAIIVTRSVRTDWGLDELTDWAVSHSIITTVEAELLLTTYPANTTRRRIGRTPDVHRQQCSRIKKRLIVAVQAELATHLDQAASSDSEVRSALAA